MEEVLPGEAQASANGMLLGGLGPYLAIVNYEGETKRRVISSSFPAGMEAELGAQVQRGAADERRRAIPHVAGAILHKATQASSSEWAHRRYQKNALLTSSCEG